MKKIKLTKKGDRHFVHPSKLTINPLNEKIYNKKQDQEVVDRLVESFKHNEKEGLCPNEQPVAIWLDG